MTRLNPIFTGLKTLNITYQTPQETLLSTPQTLPTSEPSTPQIGYTVAEADLPSLSILVYRPIWVAYVIGAGKFSTAGTIYWRMKKNGVSVNTYSVSVSANYYYTINAFFYDVKVSDLLELALWSSVSDSNWDYKAYQIQLTRLIPLNKPRLLSPCIFAAPAVQPTLTLGNPSVYATGNLYPDHCDSLLPYLSAAKTYKCLYPGDTMGLFHIQYGDSAVPNNAYERTSSAYRPLYYRNNVPTQIKFRGVYIE